MSRRTTEGRIRPLLPGVLILGALAGCARSEHPLSTPEDGFVDPYLLGTWYAVTIDADGTLDTPHDSVFEIVDLGDGILQVTGNRETGGANVYSGHSTRLGANKYFNLRDKECRECGDLAARAARSDECPYQIVQYSTFVPAELSEELHEHGVLPVAELETWMKNMRGQLLFYRGINDAPVREAVERGDLEGDFVRLDPIETVCIRSAGDVLRAFVVSAAGKSAMSDWALLSRVSLRGETLDGISIATPRKQLITELLEGGCQGPDTVIGETPDEILTLGYAESVGDYRVKRLRLEDDRLAEIRYEAPDAASLFAWAAQATTKLSHGQARGTTSKVWVSNTASHDVALPGAYYLPLLECFNKLNAGEKQPGDIEEATEMLSACMSNNGWGLTNVSGSTRPVCRGAKS